MSKTKIAIACQGGGSHTAFTAGALKHQATVPGRIDTRRTGTAPGMPKARVSSKGAKASRVFSRRSSNTGPASCPGERTAHRRCLAVASQKSTPDELAPSYWGNQSGPYRAGQAASLRSRYLLESGNMCFILTIRTKKNICLEGAAGDPPTLVG